MVPFLGLQRVCSEIGPEILEALWWGVFQVLKSLREPCLTSQTHADKTIYLINLRIPQSPHVASEGILFPKPFLIS